MRKDEFLNSLEQLLWDLKEEDRKEALQYYIDYFEDAGISDDRDVIEEFGRPEKVAARIKVELTEEHSEYSEQGFEDIRFEENYRTMLEPSGDSLGKEEWETVGEDVIQKKQKKEKAPLNLWKIIGIVIVLIFAAPILFPIVFGAAALVLGLVIGAIALVGSLILGCIGVFLAIALGGLAAGVILLFNGMIKVFTIPSLGAISLGVGGLFLSGGILASLALIWVAVKIFPWMLKGIINFLNKIFHKGGKKA